MHKKQIIWLLIALTFETNYYYYVLQRHNPQPEADQRVEERIRRYR